VWFESAPAAPLRGVVCLHTFACFESQIKGFCYQTGGEFIKDLKRSPDSLSCGTGIPQVDAVDVFLDVGLVDVGVPHGVVEIFNPQPSTLALQPSTLNPQPQPDTLNPRPEGVFYSLLVKERPEEEEEEEEGLKVGSPSASSTDATNG